MTPANRKNAAALAIAATIVCGFEGTKLVAYRDYNGIPTICMGETRGVKMGEHKTPAECKDMLVPRLEEFSDGVDKCLKVDLPPKRRAAAISLAYNIGTKRFCGSSVARLLNKGDVQGGCDAFLLYNKASGDVLPGLTRRRHEERGLCLQGD